MRNKDESTTIVNFLTHGAGALMLRCNLVCHTVIMHSFLKNLPPYYQA